MQCTNAMKCAGIKKVYYTGDDGVLIVEKVKDLETEHMSYSQRRHLDEDHCIWHL